LAQFRTAADIIDRALSNAGEVTNGNSAYESQALDFINKVHFAIVAGGTIPLGKDATVQIDESWPWAKAARPLILELQPKVDTGSVTLTQGSEVGTFSDAPAASLAGWFIRVTGRDEVIRIGAHTAGATAFELDSAYPDDSGSGLLFTCFKLDYDLIPDYVVIDASNNKLQFQESAGVTLTATLTSGTYTPAQLATEVQTQLNATGGTPAYTASYSTTTRKFTLGSDRASSAVFVLVGTGSQADFSAHKTLGFDDEDTTNAASVVSTYVLGGIARLIEPMKINKLQHGLVCGLDSQSFARENSLNYISEAYPTQFAKVTEKNNGTITVRFNAYPIDKTRVEVEYVPVPRDLKDSSASIPILPRKDVEVLEDAATFFIMLLKSDDRMNIFSQLVQGKLNAMISSHRGSLLRSGENFAQMIPRVDLLNRRQRRIKTEAY
jgi:hypothetical protein